MLTSEQFFLYLRSALNHLYDPYFLRKSPLVKSFGLGDQPDTPTALQRILNEAIAALEPHPGDPNPVQRQRNYELIMYRYVQQFGQEEVAVQLGLSVRHLRREQNTAVYELAAYLWERYHLGTRPFQVTDLEAEEGQNPPAEITEREKLSEAQHANDGAGDLDWLKDLPSAEPAVLNQVLPGVLEISQPLADRYGVRVTLALEEPLPGLAVQPMALRQMCNVLSVAICRQTGSDLQISAAASHGQVEIGITGRKSGEEQRPLSEDERSNLEMAGRLVRFYNGQFSPQTEHAPFSATIILPAFQQRTVLVIDDNVDFIQLIDRSVTGTRYRVIGERDPMQAVSMAERVLPDIILLDVMMPHIDGWEILGRLRRHPTTAHIPVLICTILQQEELARSLGASGFVRKPVTQEKILSELDRHSPLLEQGSR